MILFHNFLPLGILERTMESDSKRIVAVSIFSPKLAAPVFGRRIRLYHVAFVVLYFYQVFWVCSTIGLPYRQFLEKADREGFAGTNPKLAHFGIRKIGTVRAMLAKEVDRVFQLLIFSLLVPYSHGGSYQNACSAGV